MSSASSASSASPPLSSPSTDTASQPSREKESQFLPILPKPRWQPLNPDRLRKIQSSRGAVQSGDPSLAPKSCSIPFCRRSGCSLRTHRQYRSVTSSSSEDSGDTVPITASNPPDGSPWMPTMVTGGVAGFPNMPLQSLEYTKFRNLLHVFFIYMYDRIDVLLTPPTINASEVARRHRDKEDLFAVAMSTPVYALNFIATTHQHSYLRGDSWEHKRTTAVINGELLRLTREKLSNFDPSHVEQLILVVMTLVMFDLSQGKITSLNFHRKAMESLVDSRGGLHNMGRSIPYVLNLDRIIAIHTGKEPTYSPLPNRATTIQRAARHPKIYGSFFDTDPRQRHIDPEIVDHCAETCRAVEILEGEDWNFDPMQPRESSEIHYFYFLRDRITDQWARLNARHIGRHTKVRCVLLAAKIVEYTVLVDNYLISLPVFIADRLQEAIRRQEIDTLWAGWEDVFRWVIFSLISMVNPWHGHKWALMTAKEGLDSQYGSSSWPSDWSQQEWNNVRRFTWSDTRMKQGFDKSCEELGKLSPDRKNLV